MPHAASQQRRSRCSVHTIVQVFCWFICSGASFFSRFNTLGAQSIQGGPAAAWRQRPEVHAPTAAAAAAAAALRRPAAGECVALSPGRKSPGPLLICALWHRGRRCMHAHETHTLARSLPGGSPGRHEETPGADGAPKLARPGAAGPTQHTGGGRSPHKHHTTPLRTIRGGANNRQTGGGGGPQRAHSGSGRRQAACRRCAGAAAAAPAGVRGGCIARPRRPANGSARSLRCEERPSQSTANNFGEAKVGQPGPQGSPGAGARRAGAPACLMCLVTVGLPHATHTRHTAQSAPTRQDPPPAELCYRRPRGSPRPGPVLPAGRGQPLCICVAGVAAATLQTCPMWHASRGSR